MARSNLPRATVVTLIESALAALKRGDTTEALKALQNAERAAPDDVNVKLNIALARRMRGEFDGAITALDAALAIDPYLFVALLSKGAILEKMGRSRWAAAIYRNALKIAPPADKCPPSLKAPIERGRECVAQDTEALSTFLRDNLQEVMQRHGQSGTSRFDECLDVFVGKKRVYVSEPLQLHFPGLPAIQFYDRALFAWLGELESATDTIRAELLALIRSHMDGFAPYIAYPPGAPVNQWAELNHSRLWSSFWLWRDGKRETEAMAMCPRTTALLDRLPLANQAGVAPTAMFSALAGHTRIPAHTGSSNIRLIVHLPLILPGPARFRVGNDERTWRMGEAWVFDDTIEHEAWNDADTTRFILIFDIWNPFLTQAERELVTAMMTARGAYDALDATGRDR